MKTITRDNYEAYIIDFVDNTLTTELSAEMLTLLNLHPDIADEVLQFRNLKVTPDHTITFAGKADLMRPETPANIKRRLRRPIIIAASLMMITGVLGWCLYIGDDHGQAKMIDTEAPLKYKPIDESINTKVENPAELKKIDNQPGPIAHREATSQVITNKQQRRDKTTKQVIVASQQDTQEVIVQENLVSVSNPITTNQNPTTQRIPTVAKATSTPQDQVTLIQDLARLTPAKSYLSIDTESYIADLDMELIEIHRDKKLLFYQGADRRIISTLATALIPSFASEEVLFLPEQLDNLEIEFLPTYIKNRKVKY